MSGCNLRTALVGPGQFFKFGSTAAHFGPMRASKALLCHLFGRDGTTFSLIYPGNATSQMVHGHRQPEHSPHRVLIGFCR